MANTQQKLAMVAHIMREVSEDGATDQSVRDWASRTMNDALVAVSTGKLVVAPDVTYAVETLQDILDSPDDHDLDQDEGEQIEAAITLLTEHGTVIADAIGD